MMFFMDTVDWTTGFQNKSGRELSSHLSELIVSFYNDVVVGKCNHVFIIRDPYAILFLYSRKDKSKVICWETLID